MEHQKGQAATRCVIVKVRIVMPSMHIAVGPTHMPMEEPPTAGAVGCKGGQGGRVMREGLDGERVVER